MTAWRTDMAAIPYVRDVTQEFDVIVINAEGRRWRITDCVKNGSGQICQYDPDWGYEPIEHYYSDKDFLRVTHWAPIELPDEEDDRPVATQDQIG